MLQYCLLLISLLTKCILFVRELDSLRESEQQQQGGAGVTRSVASSSSSRISGGAISGGSANSNNAKMTATSSTVRRVRNGASQRRLFFQTSWQALESLVRSHGSERECKWMEEASNKFGFSLP